MKIGIITIQKSEVNFGACLQSYALWKYISDLGHDCEVIDLLRPCHSKYVLSPSFGEVKTTLNIRLRRKFHKIYSCVKKTAKKSIGLEKYHHFNNKVRYSSCYKSVESLYIDPPKYDIIITGSDQVWNPYMPFVNAPYFLTFSKESRKISYASSFGVVSIPDNVTNDYRAWLSSYSYLSTREQSGARIIESLLGKVPQVVVDPVFLLTDEQWRREYQQYSDLTPKKYVFLYMLHYSEELLRHAELIAKKEKLPLFFVLSENRVVATQSAIQLANIGPGEWMWLIDNASMVITNSFHGSAFSIIFKVPLAVFLKKGQPTNTRIEGLFSTLGISDHLIDIDANIDYNQLDFRLSNQMKVLLESEITKSVEYLNAAILND